VESAAAGKTTAAAGKSTTVKMFAGLLHPSDGQILYNGRNVREDLIGFRRCLGYVPEEPNLSGSDGRVGATGGGVTL